MKTRKLLTAVIAFLAFAVTTLAQNKITALPPEGIGCEVAENFAATGITTSTANLSWTSPSGLIPWEIEVIPATGTPTRLGIVYNGASLPYVATGLLPATAYVYYVRSSSGCNWIGPNQFTTSSILSNTQSLCTKSIQPYNVNVGDATHVGSTYAWSIAPATPSAIMTGNGTNAITIDWTNAPSGTYTLKAIETSTDGCISTAVSASINLSTTPIAPVSPATQTFCSASTVANLTATGTNLQWYAVSTGGTALPSTTVLVTGTTYYVSQTTGTCESTRTAVEVTISPLTAPTAVAQTFCTSATVANLVATGTAIKWYANLIGGTTLASTTALVTGTTYYASQTVGTCESARTAVAVTITPIAAPTAVAQTFCTASTVANLVATGTAIKWYSATTGGTALTATTALITGNYYVSQTVGLCESNRTVVAVSVNANVAPTFTPVAPICSGGIVASLPTTSNNGITGNWTPAINNTKTTLYTFTPTAGQCASTTTQTITITTPKVTSAISFVAPVQNLSVGMTYGGGKIIYLFQPGDAGYVSGQTHGLIIAIGAITTTSTGFDCGSYTSTFGCLGVLTGKTSTAMGTGISNTNQLVASCGAGTVASICDSLVENGYSDWFLPSKDELSKVYQNYSLVGGAYPITSQGVWSSSEVNANSGYVCSFDGGGGWVVLPKNYGFCVKPLRKF